MVVRGGWEARRTSGMTMGGRRWRSGVTEGLVVVRGWKLAC